ncbi:helix-turn-helix domain-containing protein [Paenibacillus sp. P26]|nr:helix-turn-helix domain-containing protein [Paenibacillus sp. P26]UUZ93401.1 helix-turn-helix domain-containing protein [Paenibacillus sp. P25]
MNVMLVDDDYLVLEFILKIVPWEKLNLELHSVHKNGLSAYEAALERMPDILLTDIGMPKMNGLELIAKLKEKKPNLRTAILSCHNEFHYAQQALKMNVQDYLLKDMLVPSDLNRLLQKLKESLEEEVREETQRQRLRQDIDSKRDLAKERFIRQTIDQPILSLEHWWREAESFGIPRSGTAFFPVILSIDYYLQTCKRFVSDETLRFAIGNVLEEAVASFNDRVIFFPYKGHQSFLIFCFHDTIKRNIYDEVTVQLEIVQKHLHQALKLTATFQSCDVCQTVEDLKARLGSLLAGYDQRFYLSPGSMAALKRIEFDDTDLFSHYDDMSQKFRDRFIASDAAGLFKAIEMWNQQLLLLPHPPELVKNWIFKLLIDLRLKLQSLQNFSIDLSVDMMHKEIFDINSIFELQSWLIEQIEKAIPSTDSIVRMAGRPELVQARQYVLQRMDKIITLEEVAEHLHMNTSYFSRLFSHELGETFKEFVTRVKMERAKELLDQTNYSISTICDKLGYKSQSYFTRRFKACFGITPLEYKIKGEQH